MKILNLTQHPASPDQIKAGVVEPINKEEIKSLLTFTSLPTREEVKERAKKLALSVPDEIDGVMIGGAPFLMPPLEEYLKAIGLRVFYAFSKRVSIEQTLPDGSVIKKSMFKHEGFIEA